jgi:hypothetical protein
MILVISLLQIRSDQFTCMFAVSAYITVSVPEMNGLYTARNRKAGTYRAASWSESRPKKVEDLVAQDTDRQLGCGSTYGGRKGWRESNSMGTQRKRARCSID